MRNLFKDYVIEDIKRRTTTPFQYENLSSDIKVLVNKATNIYIKMHLTNQMANQLKSKRKSIFSFQKKNLLIEEKNFRKDYEKFEQEYEKVLKEIIEKLEKTKKDKPTIIIEFSSIRDFIKEKGIVLQPLKCPVCGAPLDIPNEGNIIICPYCGSTIKALDVFEKIKSLLS